MTEHIQIRSFVLGGNHGQYLQASGLRSALVSLRPEATVTHADYSNHTWDEVKMQARSLQLPKYLALRLHWARRIPLSKLDAPATIRVLGSDQVWSFSNALFPPDPVYFGADAGGSARKIAYAPAMGHVEPGFVFPPWVVDALSAFSAIAVRDEATAGVVERSLGKAPDIVVDPALFLAYPRRMDAPPRIRRLAVYCPRGRRSLSLFSKAAGKTASDLPIHLLGYVPRRAALAHLGRQLLVPETVVDHISRSAFLLTSTFHGVMMALMTRTPFLAISTSSLVARLQSPLGRETFSRNRLVSAERLAEMTEAGVAQLFDPSDIDVEKIGQLVETSRSWLDAALTRAESES